MESLAVCKKDQLSVINVLTVRIQKFIVQFIHYTVKVLNCVRLYLRYWLCTFAYKVQDMYYIQVYIYIPFTSNFSDLKMNITE